MRICIDLYKRLSKSLYTVYIKLKPTRIHQQNLEHFLNIIFLGRYKTSYFLNELSMCLLAWYDKAAQPQNMTFSQRKSWAASFLISMFFHCLGKLRKLFVKTYTIKWNCHFLKFWSSIYQRVLKAQGAKIDVCKGSIITAKM